MEKMTGKQTATTDTIGGIMNLATGFMKGNEEVQLACFYTTRTMNESSAAPEMKKTVGRGSRSMEVKYE
jgi:hypothetical protein